MENNNLTELKHYLEQEDNDIAKNSNAIQEFEKNGINWEYNHFGTLTADFYGIGIFEKVDFEHIQGDVFEICIAQSKPPVWRSAGTAPPAPMRQGIKRKDG